MHQDVVSNPAAARNENTHIGQTPVKKVPQWGPQRTGLGRWLPAQVVLFIFKMVIFVQPQLHGQCGMVLSDAILLYNYIILFYWQLLRSSFDLCVFITFQHFPMTQTSVTLVILLCWRLCKKRHCHVMTLSIIIVNIVIARDKILYFLYKVKDRMI